MTNLPANMESRLQALAAKTKANPSTVWSPTTGDTVAGEFVGVDDVINTRFGGQQQLLLRVSDGTTTAVWLGQWLKQTLKAKGLQQGGLVAITFKGKVQPTRAGGNAYNSYSVEVDNGN